MHAIGRLYAIMHVGKYCILHVGTCISVDCMQLLVCKLYCRILHVGIYMHIGRLHVGRLHCILHVDSLIDACR